MDSPLIVALRKLLNILALQISLPLPVWADGIGAYGSWGMGTNMEGSDLDLWVYSKKVPPAELSGRLRRSFRDSLSVDVQILLLTPERIQDLHMNDPPFYSSLIQSMILIRGEQSVHAWCRTILR
ncbi:MAG TPA: nucleotidyltransferase domain-containing protein [Methanolinea sp.]|nr:nucleotidyltransferase domain-containing protein [Methanolinea sp.]HQK56009.1 nucleotidyltransferase domain-containing protein [Methanolinea sp.]